MIIKKEFEKENYILLTKNYKNNKEKLSFICPLGHKHQISYDKWKQGQRCGICRKTGRKINNKKQCTKCFEIKDLNEFQKRNTKIGYNSICKKCSNKKQQKYRQTKKGKLVTQKYVNSEKRKQVQKRYEQTEKGKKKFKRYRQTEKGKSVQKKWLKTENGQKRILSNKISNMIRYSLNGVKNNNHWENLVDWTLEDLKENFEKKFQRGMSWKNHGQWHIDHIKPISSFNITDYNCSEFKECWSLDNLQPLWAKDNQKKGSKYEY